MLAKKIDKGALTSLQQRLVKTGGKLVKHARYWLLLAEGHLTKRLIGATLWRMAALPVPTGRRRGKKPGEGTRGDGEVSEKSLEMR